MKKVISVLIVALLAMSLVACGNAGGNSTVNRSDIVGDWIEEEEDGTVQYLTLTEDGRYLSETVSTMGFSLVSEHKWSYENGVFTVNYVDYGTTSVYKKVTLDGDTLTLDNGEGKIIYKRR